MIDGDLDKFVGRLEGVRKISGGYVACCPAHKDKVPSLSVAQRGDKILVYCHAGCDRESILAAMSERQESLTDLRTALVKALDQLERSA